MSSLTGITSLKLDRLYLRKPRPSLKSNNAFNLFLRNDESFSRFVNNTWTYLDNEHVAGVQDMVEHVNGYVGGLQQDVSDLRQQLLSSIRQIDSLQQEITSLEGRVTTLESRVSDEENQSSGFLAQI